MTELPPTDAETPAKPAANSDAVEAPAAPEVSELELERMRREVKARLFGGVRPPIRIGRYKVLDCIGQGGMGIVYAARDERLDRTVAIKLLRPEFSGSQTNDLGKEAQSLAKLAHPNVVAVYDVGEHDDQLFVAMEYVEGQSLRRWLLRRPSITELLSVFAAAGAGLAAAHRAGLVHRDFKPDNVLVGSDGRPRILDFGLARAPGADGVGGPPSFADDADANATSLSRHGVLLGTPAYMAPEQHLGERADARSDQFGFCVALFQAIYGVLPFPSADLRALSLAIVGGRVSTPPPRTGVPDSLRNLLIRGLKVDPDARFPDMDSLLGELEVIRGELDGRGVVSGATSSSQRSTPTSPTEVAAASAAASLTASQRFTEAPTQSTPVESKPEPAYDTRAINRAFGLEPAPAESTEPNARPRLLESEMREIADEVGLELASLARDLNPRRDAATAPVDPHRPPERTDFGLASQVRSERQLSSLPSGDTRRRIIREIEQNLGGVGRAEHFESGMTWSNAEAEANIDRHPGGAVLTLRRNFDKIARKRRRRGMALGAFGGLVTGAILTDAVPFMFMEPLFVFSGVAMGLVVGHRVAKVIHERRMSEERRILDWLGERVQVLVAADEPYRLPPSEESR
ncbi:serine/threonine kinase family protein [Plesiocystis pacifica SIR-1]|uniref:Serine/threonine kinase family protein n=1 Tax=Plesiocystis pacifica SIR-1 TaxID=391625 RepID=A6G8U3_9BACT|nr:protein kinase [Plesiocystis pacifica]EDM77753.1 serine/threonine kinase family protein [Plesiocystis pacifica SIR-1]